MMEIAVFTKDDTIYVKFPTNVFKELLKTYMGLSKRSKTAKKMDEAFVKIVKDLKKETLYV